MKNVKFAVVFCDMTVEQLGLTDNPEGRAAAKEINEAVYHLSHNEFVPYHLKLYDAFNVLRKHQSLGAVNEPALDLIAQILTITREP